MFELDKDALPQWLLDRVAIESGSCPTIEARMRLAIEFSKLNTQHGTGGPFGAAVFDMNSWKLLAAGVNRVVPVNDHRLKPVASAYGYKPD